MCALVCMTWRAMPVRKILSPNLEILNKFKSQMLTIQNCFGHLDLGFYACLVRHEVWRFGASNLDISPLKAECQ